MSKAKRFFTMHELDGRLQLYAVALDYQHALDVMDAQGSMFRGEPPGGGCSLVTARESGRSLVELTEEQAAAICFTWDDEAPDDVPPPEPMTEWPIGECLEVVAAPDRQAWCGPCGGPREVNGDGCVACRGRAS